MEEPQEQKPEVLSTHLLNIKNKNVYEVPGGYFENLASEILTRVQKKPAKVVFGNFRKNITRYASAAVVLAVIAIGSYFLMPHEKPSVANNEIIDLESSINKVSDAEIRNYVENNTVPIIEPNNIISSDVKPEDMKEMLADVSDEDLRKYIQQYGIADVTN